MESTKPTTKSRFTVHASILWGKNDKFQYEVQRRSKAYAQISVSTAEKGIDDRYWGPP